MPITLDGTNGITTPSYGGADAAEYLVPVTAFKNRIINGNMTIDQRNAGASVAFSSGAAYGADRFVSYNQNSGAYTIQQVADAPAGFKYSDKITTTTAGSTGTAGWTSFFQQRIEGYNIADLGAGTADAKTVTLSFWVKSSLTGSMPVVFLNDADRLYATTYTVNSANTWEQKTITLTLSTSGTWNSTNGRGLLISWGLGSGSTYSTSTVNSWQNLDGLYFVTGSVAVGGILNATWFVTGVQLEVGSTATSFDTRSYGTELQLCQRYFEKIGGDVSQDIYSDGYGVSGGEITYWFAYRATKRTSPTTTITGTFTKSSNLGAPYIVSAGTNTSTMAADCGSTARGYFYNGVGTYVTFSAEL